mgnify:CR=1 FL=1
MLNARAESLLCVRGNCEAEVDQMVLDFPVMAEYALLPVGRNIIYMTHGHHAGEKNPPPLKPGDILLCGHARIPACTWHEDYLYMNPGSTSIPKNGSRHSYMVWEKGDFYWKDVTDGTTYHKRNKNIRTLSERIKAESDNAAKQ